MTAAIPTRIEDLLGELQSLDHAYVVAGLLHVRESKTTAGDTTPAPGLAALLAYSQALVRNVVIPRHGMDRARRHVAVFGGTQVGKSTVINVLAGIHAAKVYHTAGFTRHAQAFVPPGEDCENVLAGLPHAFPGFECVSVTELSIDRPKEFAVELLPHAPAMPDTVLWDAPDCDAVDASQYREGLLEAITAADVVVYVTSREKYAVNAILEWLLVLLRSGTPVVACVNMVPTEQQAEILSAARDAIDRVAERHGNVDGGSASPHLLALEYLHGGQLEALVTGNVAATRKLRDTVLRQLDECNSLSRAVAALKFLAESCELLAAPAVSQLKAHENWNAAVDVAIASFIADYQSSYLDNPQRYDAFSRVGVEILSLLNPPIPGLRKALVAIRTVLSLPARALIIGTRTVWRYLSSGGTSIRKQPVIPNEVITFRDANDRLLNSLAGMPAQRIAAGGVQPFWDELQHGWSQQLKQVQSRFEAKVEEHRAHTDEWVRATAQGIYQELARDPIKLNLLRSGRIAADAGAIVVSIHTGGHGDIIHDLVVTPAMMTLVEAISQQLASSYVEQKRQELRERLLEDTTRFADEVYGTTMRQLGEQALMRSGFAELDLTKLHSMRTRFDELARQVADEGHP